MNSKFKTPNSKSNANPAPASETYGRQSLYNLMTRNSTRPSDFGNVGRFSLGRPSLLASAAKQSIGVNHGSKVVKNARDPRNKEHWERQCGIIREFLLKEEAKFDFETVIKPSKDHFEVLFIFIYSYLDPEFQFDNKTFIQTIPKIFAALKYPLPIKTSTMQTVSAQHSWPYVIDALAWLAEFVTRLKDTPRIDLGSEEENFARKHAYNFFTKCYKKKTAPGFNADNVDLFAEEKELFYRAILDDMMKRMNALQNKAVLEEDLNNLRERSRKGEYEALEATCRKQKSDIAALKDYLGRAESYIKGLEPKIPEFLAEIERKTKSLEAIEKEIDIKRSQVQNQTMSAREAREKVALCVSLRDRVRELRNDLDNCEQEPTKMQGMLFKSLKSTEKRVAEIGEEIARHAEKHFSKAEFQNKGFTILRDTRSMGLETIKKRLDIYESLLKLLLTKMDAYVAQCNQEVISGKDAENGYHKCLENIAIRKKKCDQENLEIVNACKRKLEELKIKAHETELKLDVLMKERDVEETKKYKVEKEVIDLASQMAEQQVSLMNKIDQYRSQLVLTCDSSYDDLSNQAQKFFGMQDVLFSNEAKSTKIVTDYMDLLKKVEELPFDEDQSC